MRVLFPGLIAIYEISLLVRGERHPVAIKHIKVPAALFAAVVAVDFDPECDLDPRLVTSLDMADER